jgi:outer membrane receptor protein involved in Fe transport
VSLRGDSHVVIMVDGKISALYSGPNGAQALQALPASQIERVEVITNPSAAMAPDGSAGVINLITRRTRQIGLSGSLRANQGTASRTNGGANLSWKSDKLTLTGSATLRHDPQHNKDIERQTDFDASGAPDLLSNQETRGRGRIDSLYLTSGIDYDFDSNTRLSGQANHSRTSYTDYNTLAFAGDDPSGDLVQSFARTNGYFDKRSDDTLSASLRRALPGDGHELTASLSYERAVNKLDNQYTQDVALPPGPPLFQDIATRSTTDLTQLDFGYTRPLPGKATLKLGYSLRVDNEGFDNRGLLGLSSLSATPDPSELDLYHFGQTINAGFATYERTLGKWTALLGLRLEATQITVDDITTHVSLRQDYLRALPSAHFAYQLDDRQQLTLSYSHRLNRPTSTDFNPFVQEEDPQHFRSGNPNLRPEDADAFEGGYQYKTDTSTYLATLFYRRNVHGVTDVVTVLPGAALLTTRENLSQNTSVGLDLQASGKLSRTLSYSLSSNLYWNEINAADIGFPDDRSAFIVSGKASLNWQVTPADLIQLNATLRGKQLMPQGYRDPMLRATFGYRHKIDDRWALTATVNDVFNTWRQRTVIETPSLYDRLDNSAHIQAAYVGFTYSFGGGPSKAAAFDFGG